MGRIAGTSRPGTSPALLPGELGGLGDIKAPKPDPRPGSNAPRYGVRMPTPLSLYLEVEPGLNLFAPSDRFAVSAIKLAQDGGDSTAMLTCGLDSEKLTIAGSIGTEHFAQLIDELSPDRRIRIAQRFGLSPAQVYFQGWPQVTTIAWDPLNQSVTCLCIGEGEDSLRTKPGAQIYERRMRRRPLDEWDPDRPDDVGVHLPFPVFNAGGRPNRSESAFPFVFGDHAYEIHLFVDDDAPQAGYWSFADALRYVAFFYVLRPNYGVSPLAFLMDTATLVGVVPSPQASDPLARALTGRVPDIGIASMSAAEAIGELCRTSGVHWRVDARNSNTERSIQVEHSLQVYASPTTAADALYIPLNRHMVWPKCWDIPRLAPFTDPSTLSEQEFAQASRGQQTILSHDRRAINSLIVMGGPRIYEVTLLLRPGWLPNDDVDIATEAQEGETEEDRAERVNNARTAAWNRLLEHFVDAEFDPETQVPLSIYHGRHPSHAAVSDVLRSWVFPDDFSYVRIVGESPYGRSGWPTALYEPYNLINPTQNVLILSDIGGGLADAADWIARRRPFGDLIARDGPTGKQAPVLRFLFGHSNPYTALAQTGWVRYSGQPHIDVHRAAVHIDDVNLFDRSLWGPEAIDENKADGETYVWAYIFGQLQVAITCTIEADCRLWTTGLTGGASFSRERCQIIETGLSTYQIRDRRSGNSHLADEPIDADPRYESRSDLEAITKQRTALAAAVGGDSVSGPVEVPWIDPSYQLGDTFSGCSGLGLEFNRYPVIERIEYTQDMGPSGAGMRTTLVLTDQRHNPDVDEEG